MREYLVFPYFVSLLIHTIFVLLISLSMPRVDKTVHIPVDFRFTTDYHTETRNIEKSDKFDRSLIPSKKTITASKAETHVKSQSVNELTTTDHSEINPAKIEGSNSGYSTVVADKPRDVSASNREMTVKESHRKVALKDVISSFVRRIEELKFYPHLARRKGLEGVVLVSVHLSRDGDLLNVSLLSSSGFEILDRSAIELVRRATPFRHDFDGEVKFELPIRYELKN